MQKNTSMSRGLKYADLIAGSRHCLEKLITDLQWRRKKIKDIPVRISKPK
jgi:hypothetical protein